MIRLRVPLSLAIIMLGVVASSLVQAGGAGQSSRKHLIDVGGYRLYLNVHTDTRRAQLPLTIVLESGGGMDSFQWGNLQPRIAEETGAVVVSYDRAGFGQSDLPETSYDIVTEVQGLHSALKQLHLEERVIFVSHSFGALLSQVYAHHWPESVNGILFLDPNSPSAMLALGGSNAIAAPKPNPQTKREQAIARIDAAGFDPYVEVYRSPLRATLPVIVLSAEKGLFPEQRQNRAFRASHELLANSVEEGELIVAEGSGHNIPAESPDLVLDAIRKLIEKTSNK